MDMYNVVQYSTVKLLFPFNLIHYIYIYKELCDGNPNDVVALYYYV